MKKIPKKYNTLKKVINEISHYLTYFWPFVVIRHIILFLFLSKEETKSYIFSNYFKLNKIFKK